MCIYTHTRTYTHMEKGVGFLALLLLGFFFKKKKSIVCATEKGLTYKKLIRKSS